MGIGSTSCSGNLPTTAHSISGSTSQVKGSNQYRVLYTFAGGYDGEYPSGQLVADHGAIFGTTSTGGTSNCGTIFRVTKLGAHSVLYSFACGRDGSNPSGLTAVDGMLYGTTGSGGTYGYGTVYSVTESGQHSVLHSFSASGDGANPTSGLLDVKATLYGETGTGGGYECGGSGCGTVYNINAGGQEAAIHYFGDGSNGYYPYGNLVAFNGLLYGTTLHTKPGTSNFGTIFAIKLTGGQAMYVNVFGGGSDGAYPNALARTATALYGTTSEGGSAECNLGFGCGTIFSVSKSGARSVLYSFENEPDGAFPSSSGLINVKGALYGTTSGGGTGADGTIYRFSASGRETVLYSLTGVPDGSGPQGLLNVRGTMYGVAQAGGSYGCYLSEGCGTVFAFTP